MKKSKLSQAEIDKLVVVERRVVEPSVLGVGTVDVCFQISVGRKHIWQYKMWSNMLMRCFGNKYKQEHPSYRDVTCCKEWLSFATFVEWVNKQVGYSRLKPYFDLDKDILKVGNKEYCPECCSIVPTEINLLFTTGKATRGDLPIGVYYNKESGNYAAQIRRFGVLNTIGRYDTVQEAFDNYKVAKEKHVKVVTKTHRDSLRPDVYAALMAWGVDIFS